MMALAVMVTGFCLPFVLIWLGMPGEVALLATIAVVWSIVLYPLVSHLCDGWFD